MVLKCAMENCNLCDKNTMSIPTIQTHITELAIFVTENTMFIPNIKNTMHCIVILDGMEIGHGMEMSDGMDMWDGMEMLNMICELDMVWKLDLV